MFHQLNCSLGGGAVKRQVPTQPEHHQEKDRVPDREGLHGQGHQPAQQVHLSRLNKYNVKTKTYLSFSLRLARDPCLFLY